MKKVDLSSLLLINPTAAAIHRGDYSCMSLKEAREPEFLVRAEFSQSSPEHPHVVLLIASFPLMYSKFIWLFCGKYTHLGSFNNSHTLYF